MIIMIAANEMNPTAVPLGSSARRADRYPASSVILPIPPLVRGGPQRSTERTIAPGPVGGITLYG
jgi:hypothetical protein